MRRYSMERRREGEVTVFTLYGEVDYLAVEEIAPEMQVAASNERLMVVNLDGVTYIDSEGIKLFYCMVSALSQNKGRLALVASGGSVERIIKISRLNTLVKLCADHEEAVSCLGDSV